MRIISPTRPAAYRRASILVHGLTGQGKTTKALMGGKPIVICTEPKAEAHVLRINPEATCWVPESCKDILDICEWLSRPDLLTKGFTRIVLDSYTELTELLPEWILRHANPTIPREIGRKIELQEYRSIQEWGMAMVRAIQDAGLPSIIIARSESKEVGRIRKVIPAGLGSSVKGLPAQLVPTVESRWDEELTTWVWDSRPNEYSQRCGLPWVDPVWSGGAEEFLAMVEQRDGVTPAVTAPVTEPVTPTVTPLPHAKDMDWIDTMLILAQTLQLSDTTPEERKAIADSWVERGKIDSDQAKADLKALLSVAPDPRKDPEGYRKAFGLVCQELREINEARKAPVSPEASAFVDEVDARLVSPETVTTLQKLIADHRIPMDKLMAYLSSKGHMLLDANGAGDLTRILADHGRKLVDIFSDSKRRTSMMAFLNTAH